MKDSRQTKLGDFAPINRVALPEPEEPYTGFNEFGDRIHPDGTFIPGDEMTDEEHLQMVKDHLARGGQDEEDGAGVPFDMYEAFHDHISGAHPIHPDDMTPELESLIAHETAKEEYRAKEEAAKNKAIGRVAIKPVSLGEAPAKVTPASTPPRHQVRVRKKPVETPPPKEKGPTSVMSDWQKARLKEQAELTDEERARRVKELNDKHIETLRRQRDNEAGEGLQHEGKGNPFDVETCSNCQGSFVDHSVGAHSMCNACLNADEKTRFSRTPAEKAKRAAERKAKKGK